jgi:hypothetical protein
LGTVDGAAAHAGYQPGDKGTVLKVLANPAGGDTRFYAVAVDKNHLRGCGIVFADDEIEPDV